ncbi:TPA: tRNA (guanosine(37)-N1)-methyltransferase TrmD [Candidatus Galligastranaerophilus gallistercoris]|nr:tRNA (guanosine(37)-N1)-methyltransferase TrmD [Candidatus Galligastranaerophilus gallistercoris]
MRFDVLTLFDDIIKNYCSYSIIKRAIQKGIIEVNTVNFRDFTHDKHKKVDDTPYGGTSGMVLMAPPIFEAYESIEKTDDFEFIMLTPQGEKFNHKMSVELSKKKQLILLCGRYEGFDERIRLGLKPKEISIGDFILTGGELGALCIIDSVSRQIEGVLNKKESSLNDSFSDELSGMLEHPQYTKPREYRGMKVPEVLLNGNHLEIENFKKEQRLIRTKIRCPDLLG